MYNDKKTAVLIVMNILYLKRTLRGVSLQFFQLMLNSSRCQGSSHYLWKDKIILHRIISVVWLTIFLSENRSLTQPRWWGKVSCSERENVRVASVTAVAYWTLMIARLSLSEWRRSSRLSEWLKAIIISYGDWITFVNEIQFYLREDCKRSWGL